MQNTLFKAVGIGLIIGGIITNVGYAATGETIMQTLEREKNTALSRLEATYTGFITNQSGFKIDDNPNFKSLACLGVIEATPLKQSFLADKNKLRNQLLNEYVDKKSALDKYNLGLSVDIQSVTAEIQTFNTVYEALTTQLLNTYKDLIQQRIEDVADYSKENQELLTQMNRQIVALDAVMNQYKTLGDVINQFNAQFLAQQGNIFDTLTTQKKSAQDALGLQLQNIIDTQARRSQNMVQYIPLLMNKKNDDIRLYGLDFDDALNKVAGKRYDAAMYATLQDQINNIRTTFYSGDMLNCQTIVTTTMDVDGYTKMVQATITDINNKLNTGISTLSKSGASSTLKEAIVSTLQDLYTTRVESIVTNFRKFAVDTYSAQIAKSETQSAQYTDLLAQKKRYDTLAAGEEKNNLRASIITNAQLLYEQAILKDLQTNVAAMLTDLGVMVDQPENPTTPTSDNPFVTVLGQLATRYPSIAGFKNVLGAAIATLDTKINQTKDNAKKLILQQIKAAVQIYVAQD